MAVATTHEYIVRTKNLAKEYTMGGQTLRALNAVDLDIRRGEYISLMGPSGSGKSTLFNMIGGLDKPSEGSVFIDEVDMAQLDASELAYLRCRRIGYIFQTFNLIMVMTALENVTLPMVFAGIPSDDAALKGIQPTVRTLAGNLRVIRRPGQMSTNSASTSGAAATTARISPPPPGSPTVLRVTSTRGLPARVASQSGREPWPWITYRMGQPGWGPTTLGGPMVTDAA